MRIHIATILSIAVLLTGFWPMNAPAYADDLYAGSRSELINSIADAIRQRAEIFSIHYKGNQDLSNDNVLTPITAFDGSERNTMIQSVYGLETIEGRLRYVTGNDIRFNFHATYAYNRDEMARLDADLQNWIDNNLSTDMYDAVKSAVITKYLSERLEYVLDASRNNAYDGYYSLATACSGYAELSWNLFQKAGLPVKLIAGYTPDGLTDTEFMKMRITSADLLALSGQDAIQQMQTLHVWNMVQIEGKWYQLDTTWLDGDRHGQPEDGTFHPQFFLGSDGDFARNHAWIQGEYPVASANWWDEDSGELKNFLKAYLNTRIYDYPAITSLEQLNTFAEDAYRSGRGSQVFRITQKVQPYDVFPILRSAASKVAHSRSDYRVAPGYPRDGYLLTLEFEGREADAVERMPDTISTLNADRGDRISPVQLMKNPEKSNHPPVKWISLSPEMLVVDGENFIAVKEGRGYIGGYTRDEAVIIPVSIEIPKLKVLLNGTVLTLNPNPVILNGRTMVPLRGIFEAMGADVTYDPADRTITGTRDSQTLFLTLGSNKALVNGREILLDVPPQLINDRSFVPARLIGESFGATVEWDGFGNRVLITE